MGFTQQDTDKILAGAISYLIDGQELYEASILLLCSLIIEEGDWRVEIRLLGSRTIYEIIQDRQNPITLKIEKALQAALSSDYPIGSLTSQVVFTNFDSNWREKFLEIIQGKAGLNQGKPIKDSPRYTWEYLFFRSPYEIEIAKALSEFDVLFLPNCIARFPKESQSREADFLVCCDGKWGIMEVDGETYHTNAAKDHDRDRLFQSHGIRVVQRYTGKRCTENPRGVVQEFLGLLKKNG